MKRNLIAYTALVVAITACSPGGTLAEQVLEGQEGIENVEIDEDSGEVKIEVQGDGDEGGSFIIGGGDVPDGFAIDVMGGGEVEGVFQQPGSDSVSLVYSASFDEVKKFYEDWVANSGFAETYKLESSDPKQINWALTDGEAATYSVTVSEGSGEVAVILITTEDQG